MTTDDHASRENAGREVDLRQVQGTVALLLAAAGGATIAPRLAPLEVAEPLAAATPAEPAAVALTDDSAAVVGDDYDLFDSIDEGPPPEGYESWEHYWEVCPLCGMG